MWITLEKPHQFNIGKSGEPHPVTPVQRREKSDPGTVLEAHTQRQVDIWEMQVHYTEGMSKSYGEVQPLGGKSELGVQLL